MGGELSLLLRKLRTRGKPGPHAAASRTAHQSASAHYFKDHLSGVSMPGAAAGGPLAVLAGVLQRFPWPPACLLILLVELCERMTYYAVTNSIPSYMSQLLRFSTPLVNGLSNGFIFTAYGSAILGGVMADSRWGKFKTIARFGALYFGGLSLLLLSSLPSSYDDFPCSATATSKGLFVLSLACIGVGTGGIKSNVSTLIADQLPDAEAAQVESLFRYFYLAINVGSLVGQFVAPLLHHGGPQCDSYQVDGWGGSRYYFSFLFTLASFALGLLVFVGGERLYIVHAPAGSQLLRVLGQRLLRRSRAPSKALSRGHGHTSSRSSLADLDESAGPMEPLRGSLDVAEAGAQGGGAVESLEEEDGGAADKRLQDDFRQMLAACKVFTVYPIYWLLYNQLFSNFILQAQWMELPSWMSVDQPPVLDPLLLVVTLPFMDSVFFPTLRKMGLECGPIWRITIGFLIISVTFLLVGGIQAAIAARGSWEADEDGDGDEVYVLREGYDKRVSVWWQVVPYCGIALSEIFTSVSGLEFAYSQAPASMKSLVMSLYLCTTAVGSVIGIAVSPLMVPANFAVMFFVMGGVMLGVAAVFWVLASRRTPGKVGGGNTYMPVDKQEMLEDSRRLLKPSTEMD